MFASTSFSSVINTDLAIASSGSSSSSVYSSPPGSPFISLLNSTATPVIGQKRSQRKPSNLTPNKSVISPSLSSNNMSTFLNNSAYSYEQVTSTLTRSPSTYQASNPSTPIGVNYSPVVNTKITVPKSPKPQRTLLILDSVITGLNLCIDDLKTKVSDLTLAVTNGYNAMAKQLLQSEAYLRHLELRISNLLKLKNSYIIHLKMRDGIQNMYDAYKKSPSKNQLKNLANIKSGWKECIKTLCLIEAQTEALLGTFRFQIEKLIGFARLCPGDIYQLQIKYGTNTKFRTRTKISKDCNQIWDNMNFSFKITIHDLLLIKINEIKFFGKNVSIGERFFDIKDLFSTTQTQRLTLNANTSGTIKLSMLITWMPFENCEENFTFYNPTQLLTLKTNDKRNTITKSTSFSEKQVDYPLVSSIQIRPNSLLLNQVIDSKTSHLSAIIDQDDDEYKLGTSISSSSTCSSSSSSLTKTEPKSSENIDLNSSIENRMSIKSISSNETANSFEYSKSDSQLSTESIQDQILPQVESLLNELIEKVDSKQTHKVEQVFENLINNLNDLRSIYIELNDSYEFLTQLDGLFNKEKEVSQGIVEELELNLDDENLNLDQVLHKYFDFLNLENENDSIKLFSSNTNINESENLKLTNDLIKVYDCEILFLSHFKNINRLLDDLSFINKNQFNNDLIQKKQSKLEQSIIDSLNFEIEILKSIYNYLNLSKEILTQNQNETHKIDLFDLLNVSESIKKDLWFKSIDKQNFFIAINLKNNFKSYFNPSPKFIRLFNDLIDKYFSYYSFNNQMSLFYFNVIFDFFKRLQSFCQNSDVTEKNILELIMNQEVSIYVYQQLFNHMIECSYDSNGLEKSMEIYEKYIADLVSIYVVEQLRVLHKPETVKMIKILSNYIK